MANNFIELTKFIPEIKNATYGEWIIDEKNDGTPEHPIHFPFVSYSKVVLDFIKALYHYCENHPEYEHTRYSKTLKINGIAWSGEEMEAADVSKADAKLIIALLIGIFRADRFCEGVLLEFFQNGCILRWLERLEEIDN